MAQTRTQRAYQSVSEDGVLTVHIYSPKRGDDGKQPVDRKISFPTAELTDEKMRHICTAKGLGFYMAGRYSTTEGDELTPQDIADYCQNLWEEMKEGKFVPGRASGTARPTPFFEALAEYLKMPLHVVMQKVQDDKTTFSPGKLAQLAKFPAVAVITARIERERAAEKEKKAKSAIKDAPEMDIAAMFADSGEEEEGEEAA